MIATHPAARFGHAELVAAASSPRGRKAIEASAAGREGERDAALRSLAAEPGTPKSRALAAALARALGAIPISVSIARRSEEHTSELQSLMRNLVCRLLLEKNKKTK